MKASEFVQAYQGKGQAAWERAAVAAAIAGNFVQWPFVPVTVSGALGSVTFFAATDYFAIGEHDDWIRMPLSPLAAQAIADHFGWLLPTKKMVDAIWQASPTKLMPEPMRPRWEKQGLNPDKRMEELGAFAEHNAVIETQLDRLVPSNLTRADLLSGQKKDVILSNATLPGHVTIYGWQDPKTGKPIQGVNPSSHPDTYADYSHGIRFIRGDAQIDGRSVPLTALLTDPQNVGGLLTDGAPLKSTRYGGKGASPYQPASWTPTNNGGGGATPVGPSGPSPVPETKRSGFFWGLAALGGILGLYWWARR